MIRLTLIPTLSIMLIGCTEGSDGNKKPDHPSLMELFDHDDEVTFIDSSPDGVKIFGDDKTLVYCELRIEKNGKVRFNSYAYNFCRFEGALQMVNDQIEITLESFSDVFWTRGEPTPIKFPTLKLVHTKDGLQLARKDGEKHLKEHWNVYDGVKIFPLILAPLEETEKQAEQDGADQPATHPESK